MLINEQQLQKILPNSRSRSGVFVSALNAAMQNHQIASPKRVAAFIAQIGHESGQFLYVREIWGPTAAQRRYEGREDLGNTVAGDGRKYCGRGLIQITGRANYAKCGKALGLDLIAHPELLELPQHAAMSAAWFWEVSGLNELADRDQFQTITRCINGGLNGLADRLEIWERAKAVLA